MNQNAQREEFSKLCEDRLQAFSDPGPLGNLGAPYFRAVETRYGWMLYPRMDVYIGRSLELYGEYSGREVDAICRLLKPGDTVVDAGANIGVHSLAFARRVGESGDVIAFEPQQAVYRLLCANMAMNGIRQVRTFQTALSDRKEIVRMPDLDLGQPGNFGGVGEGKPRPDGIPVPAVPLDNIDIQTCRLIKADVEGMESRLLKGSEQLIDRLRPCLYLEYDHFGDNTALAAFLRDVGYRAWRQCLPLYNAENFRGVADNIFGTVTSFNLLCAHRDDRRVKFVGDEVELSANLPLIADS
ncbi:FkbM family methyltransferase [Alphaproteobacteria bacterium HT1-32]|nr:FkbM family methyltransferase [Alphaproteobacteria bacterium HT1-32]